MALDTGQGVQAGQSAAGPGADTQTRDGQMGGQQVNIQDGEKEIFNTGFMSFDITCPELVYGKEVKNPATPDEIPNDQIDDVVNALKSEAQADKFVKAATKESVRAKGMNRKEAIIMEVEESRK